MRPVAASATSEAAVKVPHASSIHWRRESKGDVSSTRSAWPVVDDRAAAVVVLPARSTTFGMAMVLCSSIERLI